MRVDVSVDVRVLVGACVCIKCACIKLNRVCVGESQQVSSSFVALPRIRAHTRSASNPAAGRTFPSASERSLWPGNRCDRRAQTPPTCHTQTLVDPATTRLVGSKKEKTGECGTTWYKRKKRTPGKVELMSGALTFVRIAKRSKCFQPTPPS